MGRKNTFAAENLTINEFQLTTSLKNSKKVMKKILAILLMLSPLFTTAQEIPTQIYVRAKAKDAKFIGTSVGGALVIIRDATTGEILAKGKTEGSTGNTSKIMTTPKNRYHQLSEDQTAKFETMLNLSEPIFITVEVQAPISKRQATAIASTQLWLIPGKHLLGDGIILEIPGFIIDILSPQTHQFIDINDLPNNNIQLKANIVMMCGCTISAGGLWDGNIFDVQAIVKKNGEYMTRVPLKIGDQSNTFEGNLKITENGNYEIIVTAFDGRTGNTGVDKVNIVVE